MKKLFVLSIFLTINLIITNASFGFLNDPTGLDMYKKIDEGLYDLELKYLDKELRGGDAGGSIVDDLKKRFRANGLRDDCIKGDLQAQDVERIANDDNSLEIFGKISKECFQEKGISVADASKYIDVIKESFLENSKRAQNKTKQIYQIGRIGMYSDGIEENSPFDLMVDLSEIDKIIFEQSIPYDGVNVENLGSAVDNVLKGLVPNNAFSSKDNIIFEGKYKENTIANDNEKKYSNRNNEKKYNDGNNDVCTKDNSGLSKESLERVLQGLRGSTDVSLIKNQNLNLSSGTSNLTSNKNSTSRSSYSKVNDNPIWPCNNFFCIVIEFVTYSHKLLGGGKSLSIEGLLKRSNEHLKKFVSTSLIQSNMTINFFQLGLKDLNLPDIFHIGVQVSHKPVPIINVEKDGKDKESDEFKYKNLLTRYYKNLGLDYERANDLSIFKHTEPKLKNILEGTEMNETEAAKKEASFYEYIKRMRKENEYVSDIIINKKIIQEDMDNFYKQFAELESFTNALLDYVIGISGIISKMNEIPKKG